MTEYTLTTFVVTLPHKTLEMETTSPEEAKRIAMEYEPVPANQAHKVTVKPKTGTNE